ncbi:uncharacterized protein G6M90_00g083680 [Metarhizium brunneum]|uniref:Uncharacterized protein n=1 Tax=Metarhizium brunneum TaxID=500148 RepID=A0A7D5YWZ9_9HYPO
MKTPSPNAKRGFDKFFASTEGHEDLCQRLDAAIRQQQEATPEPSSDHESLEEDHRWQCTILHEHFGSSDIDKMRNAIWQPDYWKIECQHYANVLNQFLLRDTDGTATAQRWRTAASMYKDLLRLNGLSIDDIRLIRHSIESQKYWEKEKDVLQQQVALREHEMHEAACARKKDIQRQRRERVRRRLRAIEEEETSPPPNPKQALRLDSIATRTRLRSRSI